MANIITIKDVQAVEPVLTNMLVSYMQADSRFVADKVFPGVPVQNDSGTYYIFTKKYWFLNEMQVRAPGTPFAEGGFGAETGTYSTKQWALAYSIADEVRANSQIPGDLEQAAVQWLAQQMLIKKEIQWATDFMVTGVWSGTDTTATDWDDYSSGDPVANVLEQMRVISYKTGYSANTAVMGEVVHNALLLHPDIIDRIKHTQAATAASLNAALADVFGLSTWHVGRASYNSANESATASYAAIIDDDFLLLSVNPAAGSMGATAGKTFYWQPGGGLGSVLPMYRDEKEQRDLLRVKMQWDQVCVASDLGYLWTDIV